MPEKCGKHKYKKKNIQTLITLFIFFQITTNWNFVFNI